MLKYVETTIEGKKILNTIKDALDFLEYDPTPGPVVGTAIENTWSVVSFSNASSTGSTDCIEKMLVRGKAVSVKGSTTYEKTYYISFENKGIDEPEATTTKHSQVEIRVGEEISGPVGLEELVNPYDPTALPVIWEWSKHETPNVRTVKDPIYLYLSITNQRLAMVAVSDPSSDIDTYRKSFCYIGALNQFLGHETEQANSTGIMVTAGSETVEATLPTGVPPDTSRGNTAFQVLKTKTGVKLQKHYPAFITQAPTPTKAATVDGINTGVTLLPQGFNASAWTKKYHLSPVYVVHGVDGYRGTLGYCIAVSKNNILHLDNLIVDIPAGTAGKTWNKEYYTYFDHNTKYNFMNKSANTEMGIAILSKIDYTT